MYYTRAFFHFFKSLTYFLREWLIQTASQFSRETQSKPSFRSFAPRVYRTLICKCQSMIQPTLNFCKLFVLLLKNINKNWNTLPFLRIFCFSVFNWHFRLLIFRDYLLCFLKPRIHRYWCFFLESNVLVCNWICF